MGAIVVGTDGSPSADAAVRRAIAVAKGSGDGLHIVTAFPDAPAYRERIASTARREPIDLLDVAESVLARSARQAEAEGIDFETHARQGEPAQTIIEVAQEQGADLIVVGARGLTGLERFLLGSVSAKLSHHAPCTVMIVRDE